MHNFAAHDCIQTLYTGCKSASEFPPKTEAIRFGWIRREICDREYNKNGYENALGHPTYLHLPAQKSEKITSTRGIDWGNCGGSDGT